MKMTPDSRPSYLNDLIGNLLRYRVFGAGGSGFFNGNVGGAFFRVTRPFDGLDAEIVDDRENMKPGAKYFEWERRGVPLRLEVGPRDVEGDAVMTVRRDDRTKEPVPLAALAERVPAILESIQGDLLDSFASPSMFPAGMDYDPGRGGVWLASWEITDGVSNICDCLYLQVEAT